MLRLHRLRLGWPSITNKRLQSCEAIDQPINQSSIHLLEPIWFYNGYINFFFQLKQEHVSRTPDHALVHKMRLVLDFLREPAHTRQISQIVSPTVKSKMRKRSYTDSSNAVYTNLNAWMHALKSSFVALYMSTSESKHYLISKTKKRMRCLHIK